MATARLLLLSNSLLHKFFPKLCGCGLGNVYYQLHLSLKLGKKKKKDFLMNWEKIWNILILMTTNTIICYSADEKAVLEFKWEKSPSGWEFSWESEQSIFLLRCEGGAFAGILSPSCVQTAAPLQAMYYDISES